ncbi:hypothetical protein [Streptomyces justiciae]|uniref:hypothetical protein n=1 Tax=Streptomyces justiciae TaxID=2780140 RepID=UPI002AD4B7A0|nr:hypothetical protein [Streptomyces justiciae]
MRGAPAAHLAWKARSPCEHGSWLSRIAQAVRENGDETADLESSDNDKESES